MTLYYKQKFDYRREENRIKNIVGHIKIETIPLIALIIKNYHRELDKGMV